MRPYYLYIHTIYSSFLCLLLLLLLLLLYFYSTFSPRMFCCRFFVLPHFFTMHLLFLARFNDRGRSRLWFVYRVKLNPLHIMHSYTSVDQIFPFRSRTSTWCRFDGSFKLCGCAVVYGDLFCWTDHIWVNWDDCIVCILEQNCIKYGVVVWRITYFTVKLKRPMCCFGEIGKEKPVAFQ